MAEPSSDEDADEFFETADEIPSTSASSDSEGEQQRHQQHRFKIRLRDPAPFPFFDSKYAIWRSDPGSIGERRLRLFQKLGLDELLKQQQQQPAITSCRSFPPAATPRVVRSISDPVSDKPRCPSPESVGFLPPSTKAAVIGDPEDENAAAEEEEAEERRRSSSGSSGRDLVCRIKDLDSGREFVVSELAADGLLTKVREVGTGREVSLEELGIVQQIPKMPDNSKNGSRRRTAKGGGGGGWFRGIRSVMKRSSSDGGGGKLENSPSENSVSDSTRRPPSWKMQRIKVRVCKKAAGEMAELYMGQEIHGHQGPIWALRFSSGGRYLASGGQDCIVRVWKVVILDNQISAGKSNEENQNSSRKDRKKRGSSSRKMNDEKSRLATFGLESEPVCNLRGHTEDILDLSWSSSKLLLLSSSMDKTVRLWDVEHQDCLQIFPHSDYVTCIKFNPADDTCFLSGSLDGKVRIWSIVEHHVIDWTDLREIVTAACYTPDGTGAMIGSSKGTCRFYNTAGNKLQLDGLIEVVGKKGKSFRGKKISGIQCMPGNPSKILVTSNDSQVRLYDGTDLIAKFKGFRNMSSQISASFSGNGSFIISASEDSHVYLWNVSPPSSTCRGQLKMSEKSCESFFSDNVTAAIPWVDNEGKRPSDDRGAALNKLGSDILQLLRQSSFPGPCFECLTSTVFPVTDEATTCGSAAMISSSSSGSSSSVGMDSAPSSHDSVSKSSSAEAGVAPVAEADSGMSSSFTDESLELPAGGLGLVIVTASLSGEIRTFQNYVVKEAA